MPLLLEAKRTKSPDHSVRGRILVAEQEASCRDWLITTIRELGYDAVPVEDHGQLILEIEADEQATVILSSEFDAAGPLVAMGQLWLDGFAPRVILVSDDGSLANDDRAMRMGILGTVSRSPDPQSLRKALALAMRAPTGGCHQGSPLLGNSAPIREMRDLIRNVADIDAAVMILGESGTGKELVARAIHDCSRRAAGQFVPVNMAALPENLVESVLFGYEKGAFTGADQRQEGMCQHADGGTLFLDEIGEMNRELQPKLLRFLQNHTVQRVGSTAVQKVDARIVSATNRTEQELVSRGVLREDLFFRLNVIPIHVPALRDRKDDIPLLAEAFLKRKSLQTQRNLSFSGDVLERLCEYSWPGNIRQLESLIERMVVMARCNVIGLKCLPSEWFPGPPDVTHLGKPHTHFVTDLDQPVLVNNRRLTRMESAERQLIVESLLRHNGNVVAVARYLGVGSATVYRKMRSLGISKAIADNTIE
jgi:two-component system, NtrC family, response regulator HydG